MPVPPTSTGKMPVPQTLTGKMPVPQTLTGKMPVPQIQQARCLFHKFNRQDACSTNSTGKMPV
ncbi:MULTISPECIES: hypothetical protein, partial [unclassified Microcoleus]|uniref:hypothetical protein n=1 Tax=unclassified Microcoleus TaxID=2642155 RepID=UPI002FD5DA58